MKKNIFTVWISILTIIAVLALEIYVALTDTSQDSIRYLTEENLRDSLQNPIIGSETIVDLSKRIGSPTEKPSATLNTLELRKQVHHEIEWLEALDTEARVSVCARFLGSDDSLVINHVPMLSASLIKLYIAGCTYENMNAVVDYTGNNDYILELLDRLITISDNQAAEALVTFLGKGDYADGIHVVNQYCIKHRFYDTHMGRLIPETGEHEDNITSATDCVDFISAICDNKLIGSEELLRLMVKQTRTQKIPAGVPDFVHTANKTGELDNTENDVAIVFIPGKEYILCVMCTDVSDTELAREAIVRISESVYTYVNAFKPD